MPADSSLILKALGEWKMGRSESSKALFLALRNPPPPGQQRRRGVVRPRNDTPGPDDDGGAVEGDGRGGKRRRGDSRGIQQMAGMHDVPGGYGREVEPLQHASALTSRLERCGSFRELQVNPKP